MSEFHTWLRRIAVLCLILMMQGPAMMMQEVAWVKMLVTYTQDRGLKRGVIETFDGEHPCQLCAKAAEMREKENRQEPADRPLPSMKRLSWAEMVPSAVIVLRHAAGREISYQTPVWIAGGSGKEADAPASPPPESRA
jgi:hypothetical protein